MSGFRRAVGTGPLGLLVLVAAFALTGYVVSLLGVAGLTGGATWWQTILVWFVGAVILHDLLLFPAYALADRSLRAGLDAVRRRVPERAAPAVPVVNFVRVPALATGLTFLLFWPGIVSQGAETFRTATGLTQDPYLGRWLALVAVFWVLSAAAYAVRLGAARRGRQAAQAPKDASTT
ncbi:hypothetical protein GCM10027047_11270 [Rhodococcus aerolatus]